MLLSIPREWKEGEFRVALTPDKVEALVRRGESTPTRVT